MIYFILALDGSNHIKIGTTVRLTERIKQLVTARKADLQVLAVIDGGHAEERALHEKFKDYCIHGEWFESHPQLTDFIAMEGRPWNGKDEVPGFILINLKGTKEQSDWLDAIHRKTYIAKSVIVRLALGEWAERHGYPPFPASELEEEK